MEVPNNEVSLFRMGMSRTSKSESERWHTLIR